MENYWLFLLPAIFCTLFADKINTNVKEDKALKKVIFAFGLGLFGISVIGILIAVFKTY